MALGVIDASRNAYLNDIRTRIDAGASGGFIRIYTGPRPAKGAAITTETLLVQGTYDATSYGAASAGQITANAISGANAAASGTAAWFRVVDSDGNFVFDGNCGTSANDDMTLPSLTVTAGVPFTFSQSILTAGDA